MNLKPISPEKIELRKKFQPSFGRRKSRSLNDLQKKLMKEFLPEILISPEKKELNKFIKESKDKKVLLEIGFGIGEHLLYLARNNPDDIIIGCEVYLNSFATCLNNIYKEKLTNIRLYHNDSRYLLEKLPKDSVDKVFILFPDPWPKQRQFKRRIVNDQTVNLIYSSLKEDGKVRLATDIDSYFEQILQIFKTNGKFKQKTLPDNYTVIPKDHIETKYQKKAIKEDRVPRFIEFSKI